MQRIVLIGLSGSGKTTIGPLVAQALGWRFVDTDRMIEEQSGRPIADIFAQQGEDVFRDLESWTLAEALDESRVVIATGGGIVERDENRERLRQSAFCVWLHASVETLLARLNAATDRPLLRTDAAGTLQQMIDRRSGRYAASADWIVKTDALSEQAAADEIVRAWTLRQPQAADDLRVTTPGGSYAVRVGAGVIDELPDWLDRLGLRGSVWLVSDSEVLPRYGDRLRALLEGRRSTRQFGIAAGEQHKNLDTVREIYDWMLGGGVERGDVLLALGGGVVGDLAGFVAATVLRGIAFVQLPTTVLAMVDSAIGGKTGVDHVAGKNLVGAFYQPRLVLGDTQMLHTLPQAERAAGWAEAIKHGVIGDPVLLRDLHRHAADVRALVEPITGDLLRRAAALKVRVVSADEREQGGRILLNYGHTIGHAIEAESGYTLRHGECVAIGMMAAGSIARHLGIFDGDALGEQVQVLAAFDLPTRIPAAVDGRRAMDRIWSDKKVRDRRVRWVLPTAIGSMGVRDDVPIDLVRQVISDLQD